MRAAPGRPVLTVVRPDDAPCRHGPRWWWFRVTEAAGTVRWHIVTIVAAALAIVVPRVRAEAWTEGFTVALGGHPARTWRQHLDSWRQGNEVAHEIVWRRYGQRWDGRQFTLCCPFALPDPAALSALAARLDAERLAGVLQWQAARAAEQGGQPAAAAGRNWRALRRIGPAAALMATAAVAAGSQRVTALAPLVATRRIVVAQARHAAAAGRPGQPPSDRRQPPGRHARPRWRTAVARWLRDVIRWREAGAHRGAGGPLRTAA